MTARPTSPTPDGRWLDMIKLRPVIRLGSSLLISSLLLSACGSAEPTIVTAADDLGVSVDDDMVYDAADEAASTGAADSGPEGAVANDSAPRKLDVELSPDKQTLWDANSSAISQWIAAGIHDYDYRLQSVTPDGEAMLQIEIRNGEVDDRVATRSSSNKDAFPMLNLFDGIAELIVDEYDESKLLSVQYDSELGFPTYIEYETKNGEDDFRGWFSATQFRVASDYPEECSTAGIEFDEYRGELPEDAGELPEDVSSTRQALFSAASFCSFLQLAAVADEGDGFVETSLGGSGVERIWQGEAAGEELLVTMIDLLSEPPAETDFGYSWPAEFGEPDNDYLGWRITIAHDGDWAFFIAGD